jgi:hypothetical protein
MNLLVITSSALPLGSISTPAATIGLTQWPIPVGSRAT